MGQNQEENTIDQLLKIQQWPPSHCLGMCERVGRPFWLIFWYHVANIPLFGLIGGSHQTYFILPPI